MSRLTELDDQVSTAAKRVRILSALSWPAAVEDRFLIHWRAGRRELPDPPEVETSEDHDPPLADALGKLDRADPLQDFVARTAESYRQAIAMVCAHGTPAFLAHSQALYGGPDEEAVPGGPTVFDEAEHLLAAADALIGEDPESIWSAEEAREWLQGRIDDHFDDPLPVEIDPDMGSLAAAGSARVRIRGGVRYATVQLEQFLHHEALVHSATKRNGRSQPVTCLGLSSPRTTAVQEGLATLAEMITDSLDLQRLRRIALRVRVVKMALDGADFIEVFTALLEAGQPETEAFRSAMRIFRGGDVRGRVVFTKDVVYLKGLRRVHSFLLSALRAHRAELPSVLFAGRMTCGDAVKLAPFVADGTLHGPNVVPAWLANRDRLAAYLAWAAFGQHVDPLPLSAFE